MSDNHQDDKDLDKLLDDALKDFDKVSVKEGNAESSDSNATEKAGDGANSDAFFIEQAQMLADRMNTLFGGPDTPSGDVAPLPQDPDQILAGFKKIAEAAAMTLQGESTANDEEVARYSDSIAQALKGLQDGSENLAAPLSETDYSNMFSNLNLNDDPNNSNAFLPFMEGMMQSLLSAEILLPSIKELLEKYPKYLDENADKISAEDKTRYEKQQELYKTIAEHLETEKSDDNASVKREKFRVVLEDMRKLQEFGQPPEEILSATVGDLPIMDPNLASSGANPQCPMM